MKQICRPDDTQINWIQLLFSFKGRINRKTFWGYIGLSFLVYIGMAMFLVLLTGCASDPSDVYIISMMPITIIKFFWIDHAIAAKRLHDIDSSAFGILTFYIPIIGVVPWLITAFTRDTEKDSGISEHILSRNRKT